MKPKSDPILKIHFYHYKYEHSITKKIKYRSLCNRISDDKPSVLPTDRSPSITCKLCQTQFNLMVDKMVLG